MDRVGAYVVVSGTHPLSELTLHGPFDDEDVAEEWAQNVAQVGDWWIAPVWNTSGSAATEKGFPS